MGQPNIAAAVAFAHKIWLASMLHSHTGKALMAWLASRGSRRNAKWDEAVLIETAENPTLMRISYCQQILNKARWVRSPRQGELLAAGIAANLNRATSDFTAGDQPASAVEGFPA